MVALDKQFFHHNGTKPRSRGRSGWKSEQTKKSPDRRTADILSARRDRDTPRFSSSSNTSCANEIIYCGYCFDSETQLYYVRNRTYNPVLDRWIQRDPIGYQGGINLYEYVGGMAIAGIDPRGLAWWNPVTWWFPNGITPGVPIQQGGIPDKDLFNSAIDKIAKLQRRRGESAADCLAELAKLDRLARMYMDEIYQQAIGAEANSLYQQGALNGLNDAEWNALVTGLVGLGTFGAGGAAEIVSGNVMPWVGAPVAGALKYGGAIIAGGYPIFMAANGQEIRIPTEFWPELALLRAMQERLARARDEASVRCACGD